MVPAGTAVAQKESRLAVLGKRLLAAVRIGEGAVDGTEVERADSHLGQDVKRFPAGRVPRPDAQRLRIQNTELGWTPLRGFPAAAEGGGIACADQPAGIDPAVA